MPTLGEIIWKAVYVWLRHGREVEVDEGAIGSKAYR
jgi:hypothetical protein